jgi:rubredoxin
MDYIYNRGAEGVAEGEIKQAAADEEIDEGCQCQNCGRAINLYDEPAFIMGIYQAEEKIDQQRWCKECATDEMNYKIENH